MGLIPRKVLIGLQPGNLIPKLAVPRAPVALRWLLLDPMGTMATAGVSGEGTFPQVKP